MPRKNRAPYPRTGPIPAVRSWRWPSAASSGSYAWTSTSQTRNSRIPMARALRNWRRPGRGARTRPTGSPIRMVTPAMKPRSRVWVSLMDPGLQRAKGQDDELATGRVLGQPSLTGSPSIGLGQLFFRLPTRAIEPMGREALAPSSGGASRYALGRDADHDAHNLRRKLQVLLAGAGSFVLLRQRGGQLPPDVLAHLGQAAHLRVLLRGVVISIRTASFNETAMNETLEGSASGMAGLGVIGPSGQVTGSILRTRRRDPGQYPVPARRGPRHGRSARPVQSWPRRSRDG